MRIHDWIFLAELIVEENKSRIIKIKEAVRMLLGTDKGFNEKGTTQIFKKLELSLWWSWRESNPRPNIFVKSFLHAYFTIICRQ